MPTELKLFIVKEITEENSVDHKKTLSIFKHTAEGLEYLEDIVVPNYKISTSEVLKVYPEATEATILNP